tara:strand:+ start:11104 stop:11253 length:150 start_codon:yes stop_codon:yes gene_type:complete
MRLIKSFYYKRFASEKAVDRGYEKYILKRSPEYKQFEKGFYRDINEILK